MNEKVFIPEDFFKPEIEALKPGEIAARIFAQHCDLYEAFSMAGEKLTLSFSGGLKKTISDPSLKPIVGDWVAAHRDGHINRIKKILPRKSVIKRATKQKGEQVLAVNCSLILVANSADKGFALSRLKKYAALAENSQIPYQILLTKQDLCEDQDSILKEVRQTFNKEPFFINCLAPETLKPLLSILKPGETSLLLGPSGCGKSTLINTLSGEKIMKTSAVRKKDFKGLHTTTVRRIIPLPNGHLITDIPGIKLIEEPLPFHMSDFSAISSHAANCRFSDCRHNSEPGCAVKKAVEKGEIPASVYSAWLKHIEGGV